MKIEKTKEEWKQQLDKEQYKVLRESGTEGAFTGKYWDHHEPGVYTCAGCGASLFNSTTKFESGTGWPSFFDTMNNHMIETKTERPLFIFPRTEVHCSQCGGHLGHVFNDGPEPTGKRYCINSAALGFEGKDQK